MVRPTLSVRTAALVVGLACVSGASISFAQGRAPAAPLAKPPQQSIVGVATASPYGSILGRVSDEQGNPIAGATVSALGSTTLVAFTDAGGRFELGALLPGSYVVRAHSPGFAASQRGTVSVRPSGKAVYAVALHRVIDESTPPAARPVLEAGMSVAAAQPASAAPAPAADAAAVEDDNHSETAWRVRHAKRNVLRDSTDRVALAEADKIESEMESARQGQGFFGRALETSARLASSIADLPLSGQFNLLTIGSFDDGQGELFSLDKGPRGVASVSIGASQGSDGEWSVQGAVLQGDVQSWTLAGSYSSRLSATHRYEIGSSYSTQRYDRSTPAEIRLGVTEAASRNVGEVYGSDRLALSETVTIDYGLRFAMYDYLDHPGYFSPHLTVTLSPRDDFRIIATAARRALAPGAEEFLPTTDRPDAPWSPPERTFTSYSSATAPLTAERAVHLEGGAERDVAHVTVGVYGFHEDVADQLATLFDVPAPDRPAAPNGHYYAANVGGIRTGGWGVRVSSLAGSRVRGAVDYSVSSSRWTPSADAWLLAVSGAASSAVRMNGETLHNVTASVEADIPESGTRMTALYRVNNAFARSSADEPGGGVRFDVQVHQELTFLNFTNAQWEALIAVRNLFRDPFGAASVYDELLVIRPPKRVVGGLMVRF